MDKFPLRSHAAIFSILLVLVMTVLDGTLVNVALPVLAADLGVSDSSAVWIVTVYQLLITMLLLPLSSLGDLYSYRRNFLIGVVVFTLSSGMCALSGGFALILTARALQGVGAAFVMSVNIALTRLIYPREILGRGLALNAMVIAIATAAGPTLAGCILSVASWHWLFLINIPFGIIAFFIGKRLLPHNPPKPGKPAFDWISGVENAVVFGLLFYSLGSISRSGGDVTCIVLFAVALVAGVLYVRRQFGRPSPMLPVDLFGIRLYSLSIATSVCSFIAQNLAMISLPFMFLNSLGFSEIATGLLMTPWPLATMVTAPLAARFVERHNPGVTAACGMALFAGGVVSLIFLSHEDATVWDIAWRMELCGLGFGLFQTPNNIVMVIATPVSRTGGAGGMQSTARLVGQTLGATLVTIVFATVAGQTPAVRICLCVSAALAVCAGALSLTRAPGIRKANA
ncbi:MAG: MFS transporter [Muribaculaceae bacterium]|nr:MFS transporter [Muribaculaceae bacterium]